MSVIQGDFPDTLKMNAMLFVNVHVTVHVENYISSHITLENQAWIS